MPNLPVQEIISALPAPLKRMKVVRLLAGLSGTNYQQLRFQSGQLVGNINDACVAHTLITKYFDDYGYYKIAHALLKNGSVHVDAGANYGFHTFGLFDNPLTSTMHHILIDANPDCSHCHGLTAKLYPRHKLTAIHAALSSQPGTLSLNIDPGETRTAFIGKNGGNLQVLSVPADTLDNIAYNLDIEKIDLLKMDIEGAETEALRGAKALLSKGNISCIYFEVNHSALWRLNTNIEELCKSLTEFGYRLYWPNSSMDWILQQYQNPALKQTDINVFEYNANEKLVLAEFRVDYCIAKEEVLFDLVALPESIASTLVRI